MVAMLLLLSKSSLAGDLPEADSLHKTFETEEIVVTASRFQINEKEVSRFVTAKTSKELKETAGNNVVDALSRAGGLAYKSLGPLGVSIGGMSSELFIRGIDGGELILLNGSPIQGASGKSYDLNTVPLSQVERIEILKGAASTLYGADAMSGVVNIITKKPEDELSTSAAIEFGNEGFQNHHLSFNIPGATIGLNYQHIGEQESISQNYSKEYRYAMRAEDAYSVNVNTQPFEHFNLGYLGSYYNTGFEKIYDDPSEPIEGTIQDHYKHFVHAGYNTDALKARAFGLFDRMDRQDYGEDEPVERKVNYNYGFEVNRTFSAEWLDIAAGVDFTHRGADYSDNYGEHHRNDYAVFMEAKTNFIKQMLISVGVREQFVDGESGTKDYNRFLPTAGLTYFATPEINVFANTGKAFRAPTFNQLYYNNPKRLVGNPNLEPEEGWTYELGVKWTSSLIKLRASGFYMSYKDKIETDKSSGYPYTYFNSGDYNTKGIEWSAQYSPFLNAKNWVSRISFSASGYWADPVAEDVEGKEYQPGPKFQNTISMTYHSHLFGLSVGFRRLSSRQDALEAYNAIDLSSKLQFGTGYFTLNIGNLFNAQIQTSGVLDEEASNRYVYYEVGRLLKLGYQVSL